MSAVPGEPLTPKPPEVKLKDGRKLKIKLPGLAPLGSPRGTEQRGAAEPPRENPVPGRDPSEGSW